MQELKPYTAGVQKFLKNKIHLKALGDIKQVPYKGSTYIRQHSYKIRSHGNVESGICAPLI